MTWTPFDIRNTFWAGVVFIEACNVGIAILKLAWKGALAAK